MTGQRLGEYLIAASVPVAVLIMTVRWLFLPAGHVPRWRVRHTRLRARLRLYPGRGHATVVELSRYWSRRNSFRNSGRSRPSLPARQRARHSCEHSVLLGSAQYRHGLRVPVDEHLLVMSPPRAGKTGWLARVILHYPGPVVSTTTKHDVFQLTSGIRSRRGPVQVFNPQRVGAVESTFRWNPIEGCQDEATAIRRADAFASAISVKGVEDGSFWAGKASDYLRAFFHAAALGGLDFRHVARWVLTGAGEQAEQILWDHGAEHWAAQLAELRSDASKTTATIRMTMSRAITFFTDPQLALSVLPAPGQGLHIGDFLRERGTLYLIAEARGEDSPVAPLFACLANEIHHTAALLGSRMPGGRLDPPLLMALDEVTQICPVPVPSWLADAGGKGIQIITVAHGEAQLRSRWGYDGARIIMDTSGTKMLLPGISDPATLDMASKLCGEAGLREHGTDNRFRHPVMTPEMIRQLPAGHALVIRLGHSPVIARLPMAWQDRSYKHARRNGLAVATLVPASMPVAIQPPTPEAPADLTGTRNPAGVHALRHDGGAGHGSRPGPAAGGSGAPAGQPGERYPWDV